MIRRREPNPPPMTPTRTESTAIQPQVPPVTVDPEPLYAPPQQTAPEIRDSNVTVIGKGARLEGNLVSAGSLRVEGSVKGQINAEGDVVIADGAEVAADIKAKDVTVAGSYSGNIQAAGTLELTATARVEGNVSSAAFVVASGAVFSGQSSMGGSAPGPAAPPKQSGAPPAAAAKASSGDSGTPPGGGDRPSGPGPGASQGPDPQTQASSKS